MSKNRFRKKKTVIFGALIVVAVAATLLAFWKDKDRDGLPDDWEQRIINASEKDEIEGIRDVRPGDDFDGDGFSNLEEFEHEPQSDPTDGGDPPSPDDTDSDGLPDKWEQQIINANPDDHIKGFRDVKPGDDFDEDGYSNLTEFEHDPRSDPTNAKDPLVAPPLHPLAGRKFILSAPPGDWRHAYLSYSSFPDLADYPIATVERDDRCVWELKGEKTIPDVYRIIYRSREEDKENDGAELSYTKFEKTDHPYATVEKDDPLLWKITKVMEWEDRYRIETFDDTHWNKAGLSWDKNPLGAGYPIATVEKGDPTTWRIRDENAPMPPKAKPVTHVIIFPRKGIEGEALEDLRELASDVTEHIDESGHGVLHLNLVLEAKDNDPIRTIGAGDSFEDVVKQLNDAKDPVGDLLPGTLRNPLGEADAALEDVRSLKPFPVVLPVIEKGGKRGVESICKLELKAVPPSKLKFNITLENIDDFQARLDESKESDDRVFHGKFFTYVFVDLTDEPAPVPADGD